MATITRFEDVVAWQKARQLNRQVYRLTRNKSFASDFALRDQIRRASISTMLNIAEGFARRTDKEFEQFLGIAHGSCAEVQSALYVAIDESYISELEFQETYELAAETSRLTNGFMQYLKRTSAQASGKSRARTPDSGLQTQD